MSEIKEKFLLNIFINNLLKILSNNIDGCKMKSHNIKIQNIIQLIYLAPCVSQSFEKYSFLPVVDVLHTLKWCVRVH